MSNFPQIIINGLRQVRKAWIIAVVVILALVLGLAIFTNGSLGGAIAGISGTPTTTIVNSPSATAPMDMTGMDMSGTWPAPTVEPTMNGMAMPTAAQNVTGLATPIASDDAAVLALQMQEMMSSLQGMMTQLDQKGANAAFPTATPAAAAVDMQAVMAEMQSINQAMGPLMVRIQADLQGNPSVEELASVRAQVDQINTRITNLIAQLQGSSTNAVPSAAAPATMPGMAGMPGMEQPTQPVMGSQTDPTGDRLARLEQMMVEMQAMMQQIQSGSMAGQSGQMGGMSMPMSTATPMPGMGAMPQDPAMPGMSSSGASMDDMMTMMDDMMTMMDSMMGMSSMNMATPTPMAGMSGSDPSAMNSMMMDDMMMMMDNMMKMMDDMMGMSGMSGSSSGGGMMDMMGMPDM